MLATCGAVDQYKACGLDTVHDQMKFRMLVVGGPNDSSCSASTSSNSLSSSSSNLKSSGKLRMKQLQSLAPEKKRGYLLMYVLHCVVTCSLNFFFLGERKSRLLHVKHGLAIVFLLSVKAHQKCSNWNHLWSLWYKVHHVSILGSVP